MSRPSMPRLLLGAITTLMLLAGGLTAAPAAFAEGAIAWSVKPADNDLGNGRANYAYSAEPGQVIGDAVVVTNYSADTLALDVYAADGFTTAEALLDLVPAGATSTGVGAWVSVAAGSVTVQPGDSVTIPFTLAVPAEATPGDHVGGIVTSLRSTSDAGTLTLDRRLASKVAVRVPGTLTVSAAITDLRVTASPPWNPFEPATVTVGYRLTNTGNALIYAHESARLTGLFGTGPTPPPAGETPEILPGGSIQRQVEIAGLWPVIRGQVRVEATPIGIGVSGSAPAAVGEASAWLMSPLWAGVLGALVLLAGALLVRRLAGTRRSSTASAVEPTASPFDPTSDERP